MNEINPAKGDRKPRILPVIDINHKIVPLNIKQIRTLECKNVNQGAIKPRNIVTKEVNPMLMNCSIDEFYESELKKLESVHINMRGLL